jgi:hypothetical protein
MRVEPPSETILRKDIVRDVVFLPTRFLPLVFDQITGAEPFLYKSPGEFSLTDQFG